MNHNVNGLIYSPYHSITEPTTSAISHFHDSTQDITK